MIVDKKKKCFDLWQQLVRGVLELAFCTCVWMGLCFEFSSALFLVVPLFFYGGLDFVIVYVEMSTIVSMKHRIATFKVLILSTIAN